MPILFLIVFVDLVGFGLVIPLLPFYALRFAASPQQVTLLLAVYSLMSIFTAPLWGRLSDRIGRRPVLMVSMAASALAYLWLGFARRRCGCCSRRARLPAPAPAISRRRRPISPTSRTPEERAKGMGMIGAAFGLGFIIGPALGGVARRQRPGDRRSRDPGLVAAGLSLLRLCGVVAVAAGEPAGRSAAAAAGAQPARRAFWRRCAGPVLSPADR